MELRHYVTIAVILAIGYWLGTKYPGLLSRVTGSMGQPA